MALIWIYRKKNHVLEEAKSFQDVNLFAEFDFEFIFFQNPTHVKSKNEIHQNSMCDSLKELH